MMIYLAGPMSGYPNFNYAEFEQQAGRLQAAGFTVLNPADSESENTTGKPQEWTWYMRRALRMVTHADGIALIDGWHESRGARTEVDVADSLRIPTHSVDHWVRRADAEQVGA